MRIHHWLGALGTVALLAACGDYGAPDEVVAGVAVYSNHKAGTDFTQKHTYYLDPLVNVVNDNNVTTTEAMPAEVQQAIDSNMAAYHYTPAALTAADLGIKVTRVNSTQAVWYPGYGCSYWGWYGCYYGWYYAGSYHTGTVVLEMGDLSAPAGGELPIVWGSLLYGIQLGGTYDLPRTTEAINRAFAQSPYLATTPAAAAATLP